MFGKKQKEQIEKLQNDINELLEIVKSKELEQLRQEKQQFDKQSEQLSKIKLKIKKIDQFDDEFGTKYVRVQYEQPTIVLRLDDQGVPERNDMFYAINYLFLTPLEDMQRIQKYLDLLKK